MVSMLVPDKDGSLVDINVGFSSIEDYINAKDHPEKEISWDFIRLAFMSVADFAIIPIQDYLSIGSEGRMNIPSTLGGNWTWRMKEGLLKDELAFRIKNMVHLYGRG